MWNRTKFTTMLGLEYPIVQGPFGGGLSAVELTAAVSNAGGLGSFGAQPFSAAEIISIGRDIRMRTGKPFNLNLWVNDFDPALANFSDDDYEKLTALFKPYFDESGLEVPARPTSPASQFEEQLEAIWEIKPAVFSFVYGIPAAAILEKCRRLGIRTLGAATTADEAIALEA
ncbi:MAG: nitronate monooxygenase, partial [Sphingobacteriales bacterium]